jgi:hypothetical protein
MTAAVKHCYFENSNPNPKTLKRKGTIFIGFDISK